MLSNKVRFKMTWNFFLLFFIHFAFLQQILTSAISFNESLWFPSLHAATINEFTIPTAGSGPVGITTGPDGNLWFTEQLASKIGRITPIGGVFTEFPTPTANSGPAGITAGPACNGHLWFTESIANKIGRITPEGVFTEFIVPTANAGLVFITAGPDCNLWFTEFLGNKIGRITPGGVITEFTIPTANSGPFGITLGPDGNLWFTEFNANQIGRITPAGVFTEFPIPTAGSGSSGITAGPDGNLWFAEAIGNQIGRVTPTGVFTEFPIPTASSQPIGITLGSDGNIWFTESIANQIGQITPAGDIIEFPIPTANSGPNGITAGPDGNIWFTQQLSNQIGQLVLIDTSTTLTTNPPGSSILGQPVTLTATVTPALATGTVTFFDGATSLGTVTLVGGSASLTTSSLALGPHSLTARYSGDADFKASISPVVIFTVDSPTATTTTLTTNPPSFSVLGQPVTLTATVNLALATGTVSFFDGATLLGTVTLVGGSASLTTSSLALGTHSLTARYNGDADFDASVSCVVIFTVVNPTSTATILITDPPCFSNFGQPVTLTAIVNPSLATGTVTFFDGATSLDTVALVGGSAFLTTSSLALGTHFLTARYNGDADFEASTSPVVTYIVVNPSATATTTILTIDPPCFSNFGQPITLTAIVSPATATGTVSFFDGATLLDTVALVGGSASLITSSFDVGTHFLTARYNGDANFEASISSVVTYTVVNPSAVVFLPRHLKGIQKKINKCDEKINVVNILTWKAPKKGNAPVAYRIFRNHQSTTKLIAVIPSDEKLKFKDRRVKAGKIYTYCVVSVDQFGNTSEPAIVTIK